MIQYILIYIYFNYEARCGGKFLEFVQSALAARRIIGIHFLATLYMSLQGLRVDEIRSCMTLFE